MVKPLDGLLGIFNFLEKNEVLTIGGIWVEVLSLSQLNGDDWSTLREQFGQLILSDFSWDVLHKKIGLKGLSDGLLNGVS